MGLDLGKLIDVNRPRKALDFGKPNPVQKRALDMFRQNKRIVLMLGGRQVGKAI